MSQDKTVPTTLRHNETERGFYGTNAPIRYVPEKDLVYETLSDSTSTTNSIKMPGGNKTTIKVWDGRGNNESFIDFVMQSGALIKRLNYWDDLDKAEEAIKEAKESVKKARDALQSATAKDTKLKKTQGTTESQLKSSAERVTKASADVEKATTLVEAAEEERALAVEKPFEFYGSNLSQSEQASWEKIVKQLTLDAPHKDICGKKHKEAGGKSKCIFLIVYRCTCRQGLHSMLQSCRDFMYSVDLRSPPRSTCASSVSTCKYLMMSLSGCQ